MIDYAYYTTTIGLINQKCIEVHDQFSSSARFSYNCSAMSKSKLNMSRRKGFPSYCCYPLGLFSEVNFKINLQLTSGAVLKKIVVIRSHMVLDRGGGANHKFSSLVVVPPSR